ncbi:small heat shock protein, chloroplastic-like [Juglans microcarpa x Juglans regia]|uniref:small heat shock protein, chloroplastic-like n=1 Tax=Juglans microcarpa x Juglans regia TaxID=2249226 RepID=UPI001B7DC832|nr:small heat shock protein, chloroplastic-like [Juglans microcarpa x Juglans regia]
MASSMVLRRVTAPALFSKLLNPFRSASVAPSLSRSFSTESQVTDFDKRDRAVNVDRRSDRSVSRRGVPAPFTDVFDPFSPTRSLSQVLNLMDQFLDNPFVAASQGLGAGSRRGFDVKENNDALYMRMDMPGVDKDKVKVNVEQNTLIIQGEGEKELDDDENVRRYSSRLDLPPNLYKLDAIRAEMKNGILKVVVPKVKEEERKDVIQVKVE